MAFCGAAKRLSIPIKQLSLIPSRRYHSLSPCKAASSFAQSRRSDEPSLLSHLSFLRNYSVAASDQMNLIKQLRERTSAPIKDVKAALVDSNWNIGTHILLLLLLLLLNSNVDR